MVAPETKTLANQPVFLAAADLDSGPGNLCKHSRAHNPGNRLKHVPKKLTDFFDQKEHRLFGVVWSSWPNKAHFSRHRDSGSFFRTVSIKLRCRLVAAEGTGNPDRAGNILTGLDRQGALQGNHSGKMNDSEGGSVFHGLREVA